RPIPWVNPKDRPPVASAEGLRASRGAAVFSRGAPSWGGEDGAIPASARPPLRVPGEELPPRDQAGRSGLAAARLSRIDWSMGTTGGGAVAGWAASAGGGLAAAAAAAAASAVA